MILTQALNNASMKNPAQIAVLDLGQGVSYSELRKRIGQLSYLHQTEIGHGKRVAFLSQNTCAVVQTFFAFSNIGIVSFFLNPKESDDRIARYLRELQIQHVAVSADQFARVFEINRNFGLSLIPVEIEKKKGGEYDSSYTSPPDHPLKETNPALILQVAENGEDPKYIFFNHKQIYAAANSVRKFYHLSSSEVFFTNLSWALPFSLVHSVLLPLFSGATCAVDTQEQDASAFIEYIAKFKINRFIGSAKYFFQLLAFCKTAKYTLPGVKSITVGLSTLPKGLRKTFALLKIPVMHCYGRPENLWTIGMQDLEQEESGRSLNYVCLPSTKYKVLDELGDEIPADKYQEGPFAISGDSMMTAFFQPDKTQAEKATKTAVRGEWLYTGDFAHLEKNDKYGQVFSILGRVGEIIPFEKTFLCSSRIDDAPKELPDVLDAAGFVRLNRKGEPSMACAIVRQGKSLSEAEILKYCQTRLAKNLQPLSVHIVEEIPKDEFGNVLRLSLQRLLSIP